MRPTPETDLNECWPASNLKLGDSSVVPAKFARKLERERDELREELKEIAEYGTEEINAAVDLRQKLASALIERDEARDELARIHLLLLDPHAVFLNFLHGKIAKLDWDKLEHIHGPHPAVVERDEARQDAKHWEELYRTISTY